MRAGGRLVYAGAGTSGPDRCARRGGVRSDLLHAARSVVALVAGGERRPPLVQAAAEDDRDAGAADVEALGIGAADAVVGVSASGATPYVARSGRSCHAGGRAHRVRGLRPSRSSAALVEHEIAVVVGPEFLAGSTRLKAGTAQKLVLNTISTISMIRLGKTYGNLMVDVVAANEKLPSESGGSWPLRAARRATEVDDAIADADGDARVAIVMLLARRRRGGGATAPGRVREKHRRRAGGHVVRLGVEAALVDGELVAGDVEVLGGRVAGFGLASPNGRGIAVPGFVDLQVNGFGGVDFLTADADGYRQRRGSAPRDRRHCLPPDLHHVPRRAAPRRPPRGAC